MASRKKLRRKFVNGEVDYNNLTADEKAYIDKFARKIERDMIAGKEASIPTYKEVPCQMLPGKNVAVPVNAKIVEGSDGLLYIDEEDPKNLIVSRNWKDRESGRRAAESRKQREETVKAVLDMEPTVLGED